MSNETVISNGNY